METIWWIVIVLIVIAVAAFVANRMRLTRRLEDDFGPEYEKTVAEADSQRDAEKELRARQDRREALEIRDLDSTQREQYAKEWAEIQTRFVDEPSGAVMDADRLVTQVMDDRGYPTNDFEQRAADISVDHPRFVEDYRSAHAIAGRVKDGDADTEDLRQAVVHYRALFEDLLNGRSTT